jgi:hypothetical protein
VSEPSGARAPLPADPAAWLMRRQDLLVTRVRDVMVAGRRATQIDYRVSSTAPAANQRFATVSLFCGWRPAIDARLPGGGTPCTRISSRARVRATFIPIGNRTLLVEAVWPADSAPWAQAPVGVRRLYGALLSGVSIRG